MGWGVHGVEGLVVAFTLHEPVIQAIKLGGVLLVHAFDVKSAVSMQPP